MKIAARDTTPLTRKKNHGGRPANPDSLAERLKRAGSPLTEGQARSRMRTYGLTFEEVLAFTPPTQSEIGRKGKQSSYYGKRSVPNERKTP